MRIRCRKTPGNLHVHGHLSGNLGHLVSDDNFNDRIVFNTMAEYQDFIDSKADPQPQIQSYVSCDSEKTKLYPRIQAGKLDRVEDTRNLAPILRSAIADPMYVSKFLKVVGKQP
ncbi:hypothetical protein GCM10010520_23110 [Rhizobium viscosum]